MHYGALFRGEVTKCVTVRYLGGMGGSKLRKIALRNN